jgi:hypothetical protein
MMADERQSDRERQAFTAVVLPLLLVDLLQLALDRPGPAEHSPIHFIEAAVGCIKHESARHAHGHAYGAAVKFDCEALVDQDSSPGARGQGRNAAALLANLMGKMRTGLVRCSLEKP